MSPGCPSALALSGAQRSVTARTSSGRSRSAETSSTDCMIRRLPVPPPGPTRWHGKAWHGDNSGINKPMVAVGCPVDFDIGRSTPDSAFHGLSRNGVTEASAGRWDHHVFGYSPDWTIGAPEPGDGKRGTDDRTDSGRTDRGGPGRC